MYALKTPSFLRSNNRSPPKAIASPSDPTEPTTSTDRTARARLALTNLIRSSSVSSTASPSAPMPLAQDGSYLELLSMKFNDGILKALAQPTGPAHPHELLAGRKPLPAGRGHALGAVFASELKTSHGNPHLYRAIIRCLHRPLSVLLSNISALLVPLLTSPDFHLPLIPCPNATQLHALAVASFSGEVLEEFEVLGLGKEKELDGRDDGLKSIREGLVSVVARVINPLLAGIRNELFSVIDALEKPKPAHQTKAFTASKSSVAVSHPSVVSLQSMVPVQARVLSRYVITSRASQKLLASFLLGVIWRALVALAHRPLPRHVTFLPTPVPMPPSASRFGMRLSPPSSRASSPSSSTSIKSMGSSSTATVVSASADASAVRNLLLLFPRPHVEHEATKVAREAVDEAFDALGALVTLFAVIQAEATAPGSNDGFYKEDFSSLTSRIPTLIALPVLLQVTPDQPTITSVASMLGLDENVYRAGCLAGFSRAEECAVAVAQRVLEALPADGSALVNWLEGVVSSDASEDN